MIFQIESTNESFNTKEEFFDWFGDNAANRVATEVRLQINATEAQDFFNSAKKFLWNKCENISCFDIEISFTTQNELNLDLVNSLAIFMLWRHNLNHINDSYVFNLGSLSNISEYYSFENRALRYFYFILIGNAPICEKIYIHYIFNSDDVKIDLINFLGRVEGGFANTGFPLFPIDKEFVQLFRKPISDCIDVKAKIERAVKWGNNPIKVICEEFNTDLQKYLDNDSDISELIYSSSVLTFMFFCAVYLTVYNPSDSHATIKMREQLFSDKAQFIHFYTLCNMYSMSILQLMENTIKYTDGGFFALRALRRSNNVSHTESAKFYNGEKAFSFLQISIVDLARKKDDSCKNLQQFLLDNLKKRGITILNTPNAEDIFWGREPNGNIQRSNVLKQNKINTYEFYEDYLCNSLNINHHYGLRIFVSAVTESYGHFSVVSGNNLDAETEQMKYDSHRVKLSYSTESGQYEFKYKSGENDKYYCGTYYNIQLPIIEVPPMNEGNGVLPEDLTFEAPDMVENCTDVDWDNVCNLKIKDSRITREKRIDDIVEILYKKYVDKLCSINSSAENTVVKLNNRELFKQGNQRLERLEILAKVVFGLLSRDNNDESVKINVPVCRNLVLPLSNIADMINFVLFYSRFYDRVGMNANIKPSPQVLLLYESQEGIAEYGITLSGRYLGKPLFTYRLLSGGQVAENKNSELLWDFVFGSVGARTKTNLKNIYIDENKKNNPHYFDNVIIKIKNDLDNRILEVCRWQNDLNCVLTTPIIGKEYGVLIKDEVTHMHISGVHLDRFYKVESLFTNAYWAKKFAQNFYEKIIKNIIDYGNFDKIVLYGYERLTEPMLINTVNLVKKILEGKCCKTSIDYMIYDAGYHYSASDTAPSQISGNGLNILKEENVALVYVMSISVTLQTFFQMQDCLNRNYDISDRNIKKYYYTTIQIYNINDNKRDFTDVINFPNPIEKFNGKVNFSNRKNANEKEDCNYLIAVAANWYKPENCEKCYPTNAGSNIDEMAVFCTDDSSLVPTLMIENTDKTQIKEPPQGYRDNLSFFSTSYLYGEALLNKHIQRGNAHYRSYIRTDKLVDKLLAEGEDDLNNYVENIKKKICSKTGGINIIVAPYHTTNQKWPTIINDKFFDNKAHIISFNVSKIFRSNFEFEFDNYAILINSIYKQLGIADLRIDDIVKFYYVDDQINSGDTYYRTKSLIRGLLNKALDSFEANRKKDDDNKEDEKNKVDSFVDFNFSAVFLLIDRHSNDFRKDIIDIEKYFPLFSFLSPNLRSYGDTCPLCKQVAQDKDYIDVSCLNFIAKICAERIWAHRVNEISSIKVEDIDNRRNMRRFYAENLIYKVLDSSEPKCYYVELKQAIADSCKNTNEKTEFLFSFVKMLSKPFFSYRPAVATATIKIIKEIIASIASFDGNIFEPLNIKVSVTEKGKNTYDSLISLLLVCVSGLASLNSTYLLNVENLELIIDIFDKIAVKLSKEKFIKSTERNIFSYRPDKFDSRSFSDYIIFSVFRVFRAKPYGEYRVERFANDIYAKIENCEDKNRLYFYSLLYLESGTIERELSKCVNKAIDNLKINITGKNGSQEALQSENTVSGSEYDINQALAVLISSSKPYIEETKNVNSKLCLVPLTEDGYNDAINIGYSLFDGNKHIPVFSAYDEKLKQLDGKIRLDLEASQALETIGISLCIDSLDTEGDRIVDDYVFVKFGFYNISGKLNDEVSMELEPLYLRFDKNALINFNNYGNKKSSNRIQVLKALRSVVLLRSTIIKKMKNELKNDTLNTYVTEREKTRALSITKAAKHGNAHIEATATKTWYDSKNWNLEYSVIKLVANRALSALYHKESADYINSQNSDNKILSPDTYFVSKIKESGIDDNLISGALWKKILCLSGLTLTGYYEGNSNQTLCSEITVIEDKNIDKKIRVVWGKMKIPKANIGYYGLMEDENVFTYSILLFAYNAIRHSKYYIKQSLDSKENFMYVYHEKIDKNIFFVCETYLDEETTAEQAQEKINEAKKSIMVPPWVRKSSNKDKEAGITLWTIARYFKRGWEEYMNESIDVFDVMNVELGKRNDKFTFKIKIRVIK